MKHEKEWNAWDMCGVEINENERSMFLKMVYRISGLLIRKYVYEKVNDFGLCPKCMKDFERFWGMNIADVIKSIERESFREVQAHEITGRNVETIDCFTLLDEPVIAADNEADRQALRDCFKER